MYLHYDLYDFSDNELRLVYASVGHIYSVLKFDIFYKFDKYSVNSVYNVLKKD